MKRCAAVLAIIAQPAATLPATAFDLAFPVACQLGRDCYIQQYPDRDPGSGAQDFRCGSLAYDGHDGTDIALPTRADMQRGVNVLAAAPGKVLGMRDGVADFAPVVEGKECGNGVVIAHEDGWQTQYCHMRQGSVAVSEGDNVSVGTILGQVGQSGNAAFPHMHLTVRRGDMPVDPFAPDAAGETCASVQGKGLWLDDLGYAGGGMLGIGIASAVPEFEAIKAGLASPDLPVNAPGLVVWAYVYGARAGDTIRIKLTGPAGEVVGETVVLEKTQALAFRAVGKRLTATDWPVGEYSGTAEMVRNGNRLGQMRVKVKVGN